MRGEFGNCGTRGSATADSRLRFGGRCEEATLAAKGLSSPPPPPPNPPAAPPTPASPPLEANEVRRKSAAANLPRCQPAVEIPPAVVMGVSGASCVLGMDMGPMKRREEMDMANSDGRPANEAVIRPDEIGGAHGAPAVLWGPGVDAAGPREIADGPMAICLGTDVATYPPPQWPLIERHSAVFSAGHCRAFAASTAKLSTRRQRRAY